MKQLRLLQTVVPNILATRHEFPFGGTAVKTCAFLIQRRPGTGGNVWIYSSRYTAAYLDHIAELGGVTHQLLNHRDEASSFCNILQENAPVFGHALEQEAMEQKGAVVGETYTGKEYRFGEDLMAYHTPGHARGVTTYYYKDKGLSILFTGDTLFTNAQGRLVHGPLEFHAYPGNVEDMIQTLTFYIHINPTYIISGLTASPDGSFCTKFNAEQVREQIQCLKGQQGSSS